MTIQLGPLKISFGADDPLAWIESIILIRHGLSCGNTREQDPRLIGDPRLDLTKGGELQAEQAGAGLGKDFFEEALVYTSPYLRTRKTTRHLLIGAGADGVRIFEDPRLREVEHGYESVEAQEAKRKIHGWFYYRFDGGESPADCYDRNSAVLESILRQVARKKKRHVVIVSHGLTIRCIIARFFHLTVEEFESLANPKNCAVITIAPKKRIANPLFTCGRWGLTGDIHLREEPR